MYLRFRQPVNKVPTFWVGSTRYVFTSFFSANGEDGNILFKYYITILINSDSLGQISRKCMGYAKNKYAAHKKAQSNFVKNMSVLALFVTFPVHIISFILNYPLTE